MITVNINTNANQDAQMAKWLASVNAQRTANGQSTYADANAYCTAVLTDQLLSWKSQQDNIDAEAVKQAFLVASNSVKNQVKADLGLS